MHALIVVILYALQLVQYAIVIWAIMSWLRAFDVVNFRNDLVRSVYNALDALVEPILRPIRRILPNLGGVDISPIIAILGIMFLEILIRDNLLY